jgi:hypothetical protein
MNITILLDHDLEGRAMFFEAGLRETGWDQYLNIEFKRLRDFNLSDDSTDQEIWRYVQRERLLFITNNRNRDDDTSLEAVINSENRADSLPVLTVSAQDKLASAQYRQRVADKLALVVIEIDNYLGTGRVFLP